MLESVRVCRKAILVASGRAMPLSEMRGSACEFLLPTNVIVVPLIVLNRFSSAVRGVIADMDEFLCLCFVFRRDVKFSSSGFISGGSWEILRKMRRRYMSITTDTQCILPTVVDVSHAACRT